ncbi:MAG: hypothetical protein SFW63_06650 [Alphaproteobacteria bacterium]|nr:hypothetical protein [Alphaproteobacteria bacterium]
MDNIRWTEKTRPPLKSPIPEPELNPSSEDNAFSIKVGNIVFDFTIEDELSSSVKKVSMLYHIDKEDDVAAKAVLPVDPQNNPEYVAKVIAEKFVKLFKSSETNPKSPYLIDESDDDGCFTSQCPKTIDNSRVRTDVMKTMEQAAHQLNKKTPSQPLR